MKVTPKTATYLYLITSAIDNGKLERPFTTICPECGEDTANTPHYEVNGDDPHLVVALTSDTTALVIGCEGYWLFDVRADGTVGAKEWPCDALGDEVTGIHDAACTGNHPMGGPCTGNHPTPPDDMLNGDTSNI